MRYGSIGAQVAIDRSTWRVAASSSAIWNPELPTPTTSTGPSGRACGLRLPGAVQLGNRVIQPLRGRRHERHLERPGRHHHLAGAEDTTAGPDLEALGRPAEAGDPGVQLDRDGRPHLPRHRLDRPAFGLTLPRVCARTTRSESGGNEHGRRAGQRHGDRPGAGTEYRADLQHTVPAEELAQALADHFRGQGFEAQVFRTSGDRTAMQARKESLWRNLLGVAYALTVTFTSGRVS